MNLNGMYFDIAVCIPTKNENLTISKVTAIIDRGLSHYYSGLKCVIINIDSKSDDGTSKSFLNTKTASKKLSLQASKESCTGKGINLHQFLSIASDMDVECGVVIDGDLESIEESWIQALIAPILSKKAGFVTPLYSRHKYDATITNHLCLPILFRTWGVLIHQPIGGEFSFSKEYIHSALNALNQLHLQENHLSSVIDRFGIDIFLTIHAIVGNFELHQSYLGQKIHRFREIRALKNMFLDVAFALFETISNQEKVVEKYHLVHPPETTTPPLESNLTMDRPALLSLIQEEVIALSPKSFNQYTQLINSIGTECSIDGEKDVLLTIDSQQWIVILKSLLSQNLTQSDSQSLVEALYPIFLARLANHFSTIENLDYIQAELLTQQQMKLM